MEAHQGTGQKPLMIDPVIVWTPAWSPDGKYIAFSSKRNGNFDMYLMDVDGTRQPVNLTNSDAVEGVASWSPDGQWLVFDSYGDRNGEIYIMDFSGAEPKNITTDPADDKEPAWHP
jgi:TolB protein